MGKLVFVKNLNYIQLFLPKKQLILHICHLPGNTPEYVSIDFDFITVP